MDAGTMKHDPGLCVRCRKTYVEHLPAGRCPVPPPEEALASWIYVPPNAGIEVLIEALSSPLGSPCQGCGNVVHVDSGWNKDPIQTNLCSMCRAAHFKTELVRTPFPHLELRQNGAVDAVHPDAAGFRDEYTQKDDAERDDHLLQELLGVLSKHAGETGITEGAVDVALRLSAFWRVSGADSSLVQEAKACASQALARARAWLEPATNKAGEPKTWDLDRRASAALQAVAIAERCDRLVDKLTARGETRPELTLTWKGLTSILADDLVKLLSHGDIKNLATELSNRLAPSVS